MKMERVLRGVFLVLAVLLSDVMCGVVAYEYCALEWGGRYAGWSAPPGVAFLYVIPYGVGILCCAALACFFHRRARKDREP